MINKLHDEHGGLDLLYDRMLMLGWGERFDTGRVGDDPRLREQLDEPLPLYSLDPESTGHRLIGQESLILEQSYTEHGTIRTKIRVFNLGNVIDQIKQAV